MGSPLLNPYQKNSIQTTLRRLERSLRIILSALTQAQNGVLQKFDDDLEANKKEALKQGITPMLDLIQLLSVRFELIPEPQSLRQTIASLLSSSMAELADIRTASLTRYGQVERKRKSIMVTVPAKPRSRLKTI